MTESLKGGEERATGVQGLGRNQLKLWARKK